MTRILDLICICCFTSLFFKSWYMSLFPVSRILIELVIVLGLFGFWCVSCCQLVCWLVDWNMPGVWLLLPSWRHTMPSGWFMTSVAHPHSCCEAPLPSASLFFFFFCTGESVYFVRHWPCKAGFFFNPRCWRLFSSHLLSLHCALHWLPPIDCAFCVFVWPLFLRPSHRMSPALINSAGLIRACYPVNFLTNCSSH